MGSACGRGNQHECRSIDGDQCQHQQRRQGKRTCAGYAGIGLHARVALLVAHRLSTHLPVLQSPLATAGSIVMALHGSGRTSTMHCSHGQWRQTNGAAHGTRVQSRCWLRRPWRATAAVERRAAGGVPTATRRLGHLDAGGGLLDPWRPCASSGWVISERGPSS